MARHLFDEGGAVAAEFAVVLPSVLFILAFSLALVTAQFQNSKLEQGAAIVARALGRGESELAVMAWLKANLPQSALTTKTSNSIFCATLKQGLKVGVVLPGIELSQQSCVWVGLAVPR